MKISFENFLLTEYLNIKIYTLQNDYMQVKVMNYGGIVMEIKVPNADGNLVDVALGFNDPKDYIATQYMNDCPYFGAIIGRYANRIKGGKFKIVEHEYTLDNNEGNNHLHGGIKGFDKVIWQDEIVEYDGSKALRLFIVSEDGDQGYPGKLQTEVIYYFDNENGLGIDYRATTTQTTPINLTWHGYFNLSGEGEGDVLNHELQIISHQITEVNDLGIPTGNIVDITNSPFDFSSNQSIGSRIHLTSKGYDHNYVIFPYGDRPRNIASIKSPVTGIKMTVYSTQPGLQLYTGNFLDGTHIGKSSRPYDKYAGFCLETQHFPDSPNNPHFPRTLLEPGEVFHESTVYRFTS